jgi:hypothetical protein
LEPGGARGTIVVLGAWLMKETRKEPEGALEAAWA